MDVAELTQRTRQRLGDRHPVIAVATVSPSGVTSVVTGAVRDADLEIGSVSKGITGLLYAQALERAEVSAETTLGDLLPLTGCPAGAVTLASLSTHRSGLPSLPPAAQPVRRQVALWRHGTNPYGETLEELLVQTRTVRLGRARPRYANLGFELLGHALAAAAGSTYAALVEARVAAPLGLRSVFVPATAAELRATSVVGRSRSGRPREPWTGEALGPAGGIRASVDDLATLVGALLDGSAPGVAALDPVAPFSRGLQIGAAWMVLDLRGRAITWHNGGTGGFRSFVGLDRAAGLGAVVLSATSASVDRLGFDLLAALAGERGGPAE